MYSKRMIATWTDMDFNSHMRNTGYLDKAADLRFMYFADQGISMETFTELGVGPCVTRDQVEYYSELKLQEEFTITMALAGYSEDGSRFLLQHDISKTDGKLSARIRSAGGWLDLVQRKLVVPPQPIFAAMNALERTEDFQSLPSRT